MAEGAPLRCVIVTPERAVLDEPADFVVVPMADGELGIGHERVPLIGRLGFGELRITRDKQTTPYYVDGGFVQVRRNVITVLTSKAVPPDQLKPEAALEVLRTPKIETTEAGQEAQLKAQQRARVQLRLVYKYRGE
jgi:F-type H+-transporting ATPase subunit epsilon